MARPKTKDLTERELELMHLFWKHGEMTVADLRDKLKAAGRNLAYTTVATLVRILTEKEALRQTNELRPFRFEPVRSFEDVSRNLLSDLIHRVFSGSRTQLLMTLIEQHELSAKERTVLKELLEEEQQ